MCFSAQASFVAGGLLTMAGIFNVWQVHNGAKKSMNSAQRSSLTAFASVPLLFGLHQFSEGVVWLDPTNLLAIRIFAYTAWTFWPIMISLTMTMNEFYRPNSLAIEPYAWASWPRKLISKDTRKLHLCINVLLGLICYLVFTYCLWAVEPLSVNTENGRLDYKTCQKYTDEVPEWKNKVGRFIYTYTVVCSLFLSSMNYSIVISAVTGLSAAIAYYLWWGQYESTWCYFSALISSFLLFMTHEELKAYPPSVDTKRE